MAGFFDLPVEEKKRHSMAPNDLEGYGQAYVVSEEQKLDWNDLIFLMILPTEMRKLNYWPTVVPDFRYVDNQCSHVSLFIIGLLKINRTNLLLLDVRTLIFLTTSSQFKRKNKLAKFKVSVLQFFHTNLYHFTPFGRDAVEVFSMEMNRITVELLANLSLLMNMDKDGLLRLHGALKQAMRMNYYPTCCRPDLVLGVSPHSDGSSITILLQDDNITGLQIKHKGEWFPVKPIPKALVVNIGDAIEVFRI
ncbi:protein SRG1-like [Phoenix dactylifera]|uniref:Protein SRG1-like n=1 Tax=Phoenix dactylifera TaxID=42345 RepID=A0A8B9AQP6_PHODC|nr:protein SRG1-like [Phoenix dactylifera]